MLNINPGLLIYWNSFSPVISVLISEVSVLMYTGYILSTPILTSIGSTPYLSRHVNRFSALSFYKKKKGEKKGKKGLKGRGQHQTRPNYSVDESDVDYISGVGLSSGR